MNILQSAGLKRRAATLLEQTQPEYRKLVTIHAAVSFGALLVISLIQLLLNLTMTNEAGISGIGTSAIFTTAKATLGVISGILLPFWEVGVLYTSVRVVRHQEAEFHHLTRGLRRWGVVLRHYLLLLMLYFGVLMLLTNVLPIFIDLLPMPQTLENAIKALDPAEITDPMALIEALPMEALMAYLRPISILFMAVFAGILIWLSYRFRMSQYLLMDDPAVPALPALVLSNQMTKGHKWSLCKLDLSFWWYYLLQFVASAISFGPVLLELAGVSLPIAADVQFFLFQALYCAAGVAIAWFFGAYVQTTYACAYDELRTPPQDQTIITV